MLGVVLWSDAQDKKAVIWCEDHGDLAFFNGGSELPDALMDFDAGDLVQFELSEESQQRYARNPRRVEQGAYAGLPDALTTAAQKPAPAPRPIAPVPHQEAVGSADVIPFAAVQAHRADRNLVTA